MPPAPTGFPALPIAQVHARLTAAGERFELEERVIDGIPTRTWKHAPATLSELFQRTGLHLERTFVVHEDERVSYAAFRRAVLTLARTLREQGLAQGERVALVMRNLPEWPVGYFAAALCGAIVTPLNAWWSAPELAYALRDSGASFAILDAERHARLRDVLPSCTALRCIYVTRQPELAESERVHRLESVLGEIAQWGALSDREPPPLTLAPDDHATLFYTSGTTGKPKGALATHRNVLTNIFTQAFAMARPLLRRGQPAPAAPSPSDPQRVVLLVVPFFHVTGCNVLLNPALYLGSKLVLMRKWDAEQALGLIERERVTSTGGVPTVAWQLLEHPHRERYDLSSLTSVNYGGAPSAPELVRRLRVALPSAIPGNSWGMTETSGTFTSNYAEDYERRPDSCGVPTPVSELKIMSLDGTRELTVGEVGELWVRGPQVIRGYWGLPDASARTFVEGWVRTGDLARVDDEGFLYIVDRAKDILIRGGENIYCIQVENALYEHPAVIDAAVVGIPHRTLGEEPGAVVHLKPDADVDEAELQQFLAGRLARFEIPVKILFWPEPLPRNPAGKIVKQQLKPALAG